MENILDYQGRNIILSIISSIIMLTSTSVFSQNNVLLEQLPRPVIDSYELSIKPSLDGSWSGGRSKMSLLSQDSGD